MLYRCMKGKTRDFIAGTSLASTCPIFVKCSLKASAMSPEVLIVLLSTDLAMFNFRGLPLLAELSEK